MKKNKPMHGWLFAVISLVILLGISVYLGVSGWYFTTDFSQNNDLVLGNNVEIAVKKNESATASFSFSGGIIPGEKLPQIVSIKNMSEEGKTFLRAKIYIFMADSSLATMSLVTSNNWVYNEDGYYYFTDELISQGKANLASHIVMDENSALCGEKNYIMTILVESVDTTLQVQDIWGINPLDLKNGEQ